MRLFHRPEKAPPEAVARLDPDERVVSWAPVPGGAVVATPLGLWLPGHPDRLPWHLIDKATWQGGILTLIPAVDAGDGVLVEQPPRAVRLDQPRDIPQTVRVRVQKAIAFTRHHPLPGPEGRGVRRGGPGRRPPGARPRRRDLAARLRRRGGPGRPGRPVGRGPVRRTGPGRARSVTFCSQTPGTTRVQARCGPGAITLLAHRFRC